MKNLHQKLDDDDRLLDLDFEGWIDAIDRQAKTLDLADRDVLPLRARTIIRSWIEGDFIVGIHNLPFPINSALQFIQFRANNAYYCFHHGLWYWKEIKGERKLVIDNLSLASTQVVAGGEI